MGRVVTIELNTIAELFTVADADPFAASPTVEPGVDQLAVELKTRPGLPERVILALPPDQVDDGTEERARQALRRWCDRATRLADREAAALRWRGVKALQAGLLFLALCLAGAALIEQIFPPGGLLNQLFGEGLVIAGWVALWIPVEILLYDRLMVWQRKRLYGAMGALPLEVRVREQFPEASA